MKNNEAVNIKSTILDFGRNVKVIRHIISSSDKAVTQSDFAKICGLSQVTVAKIETFALDPQIRTIIAISNGVKVSPILLLAGKDIVRSIQVFVSELGIGTQSKTLDGKKGVEHKKSLKDLIELGAMDHIVEILQILKEILSDNPGKKLSPSTLLAAFIAVRTIGVNALLTSALFGYATYDEKDISDQSTEKYYRPNVDKKLISHINKELL